jgi:hypothetical protein
MPLERKHIPPSGVLFDLPQGHAHQSETEPNKDLLSGWTILPKIPPTQPAQDQKPTPESPESAATDSPTGQS